METYYIYKICCNDNSVEGFYIGSTINFRVRKSNHKSNCNGNKVNCKIYKTIRENGGWENWRIVIVEQIPNCSKLQAQIREEELRVELDATLNSNSAYCSLSKEEYIRKYREENKEQIAIYKKKYNEANKEQIKQKFDCKCGGKYTYQNKARHLTSPKHLKYIENNI